MNDRSLYGPAPVFDRFVAGLILALGLGLLGLTLGGGWHAGFQSAQAISGGVPPLLWESLTTLGDERVLLALLLPFSLRYPRVFWAIVVGSLLAALVCRGFKFGLPLPRPAAVLEAGEITVIGWRLKGLSFPSGHTASAFAFAVVWLAQLGWRRAWPLLGLAAVAGFSRIAVGAHWPVDVFGGALIGTASAWAGLRLARQFRWGLRPGAHWTLIVIAVIAVATLPFDGQGYPGSLPWRIVASLWGLGGFVHCYLRPLLKGGWAAASQSLRDEIKA